MTLPSYVLGVDGGNSKTDYLLYDTQGFRVAHLRAGTCSHEALGYDGAREEMALQVGRLLDGKGLAPADIAASAFGLAGIDQPEQGKALAQIIHALGFSRSVAANDSFLGIKAGSESGVGVCSVNGTGTVAGGIDHHGHQVQVGGFGAALTGDEAGGTYIASRAIRTVYDELFRFGDATALTPRMLALFGCADPADLHTAISTQFQYGAAVTSLQVIGLLFEASDAGDPVARALVEQVADGLARTAAGCAVRLDFGSVVPVILIGSVWAKGRHAPMLDHFKTQFARYAQKPCDTVVLDVPPAVGSILWALELASGEVPAGPLRRRVFEQAKDL